jgi:integrase
LDKEQSQEPATKKEVTQESIKGGLKMQKGHIVKISDRWYVRYWERRSVNGTVEQKRVSHCLGAVATRGKNPPADIKDAAEEHMATVNGGKISAERITTIGEFVENVYLKWVDEHKRPSTARSYHDIWEGHLQPLCAADWMKNVRTFHVQNWLNTIGQKGLSRNSLKHIKSVISAIFKLAKQLDYFQGENPAKDTAVSPSAAAPEETYAYSLEEVFSILAHIPEPATTAFAVAAFTGLRIGEIEGLRWEDYHGGEINVSRSIWNGKATEPKTRTSAAPVPVIRHLAERLEMHRMRSKAHSVPRVKSESGPLFKTEKGTSQNMNNLLSRLIRPALNRCVTCHKPEGECDQKITHKYERDASLPEWHGWHACRRGLGSNLYRLGVPDMVIQRILRHANVSTTTAYYIKTAAGDVREAMTKFENSITKSDLDTTWTPETGTSQRM